LIACPGAPDRPATKIIGGYVRYLDPDTAPADPDEIALNSFTPHVTKRLSFEHEREVRLLLWALDPDQTSRYTSEVRVPGIHVPVDLQTLIEHVYVAPGSAAWFTELVEETARRYGFEARGIRSELDLEPTAYRLQHRDDKGAVLRVRRIIRSVPELRLAGLPPEDR
jgi:hypothetical protein